MERQLGKGNLGGGQRNEFSYSERLPPMLGRTLTALFFIEISLENRGKIGDNECGYDKNTDRLDIRCWGKQTLRIPYRTRIERIHTYKY